jgi:hypothetical protein
LSDDSERIRQPALAAEEHAGVILRERFKAWRRDGSRVFTIIAPSGVGKSSFLRAGLWPRLARQSG